MRDLNECIQQYLSAWHSRNDDNEYVSAGITGLSAAEILQMFEHPALRLPEHKHAGVSLMVDLMAENDSMYFDAIYGAMYGREDIRGWLIPMMKEIDFIEFTPTQPSAVFARSSDTWTLDEWQMFAVFGDDRIPLPKGVSVRRYVDGFITQACDVYDTASMRQPGPDGSVADIPGVPVVNWVRDQSVPDHRIGMTDVSKLCTQFHPTESVYFDPVHGEFHGRDAIAAWLSTHLAGMENVVREAVGPALTNGATSVQEWQHILVQPNGERTFLTRGTSVQRTDGQFITYAADYYDAASLLSA
ncbi:MAG: hypothetical protein EBY23_05690 [Actinobacteria bacterium]|nr:hypothetical protein [Actinomycetota bacterium]